ncbi:Periplasmic [Fe] hydrogenase large subunit [Koleobacter methoxysyntrophicus]|uniref:Periplasmic [Fe] hydrogenase large subunit n=2 Tax=Koleobacter methoxysyntrophicus TaxID=2751313 RepID=A0A8A0RQ17_9FIRM|nr:Periplasmic [Fe] hydrogenase large subunit [Koleobacter methoxysyntrophicus]
MKMEQIYHSVTLDRDKCRGCTNCIKNCPTEAIRVRDGKAVILETKCIDCGECIRICPQHAKTATTDSLKILQNYKFNIAIPAPSFCGQFKEDIDVNKLLNALKAVGFNEVYEVAEAAERVTIATREYLKKKDRKKPSISSSCPAIIRLIQIRFPELIDNIIPVKSPMEVTGRIAREKAISLGYRDEDIGIFFITPCPAKVTSIKQPVGSEKSHVNGAFSIAQVYGEVLKNLNSIKDGEVEAIQRSSGVGISWGRAGGENQAIGRNNHLSVDGIHNVIDVLEEVEMGKLNNVDYIECQACIGGCIGGVLTVENHFIARVKLRRLAEKYGEESKLDEKEVLDDYKQGKYFMEEKIQPKPVLQLDDNLGQAIKKMELMEDILKNLPGLDCGACGSPNCRALAEDIVRGYASELDCIFKLRKRVKELAEEMVALSKKVPPAMGIEDTEEGGKLIDTETGTDSG